MDPAEEAAAAEAIAALEGMGETVETYSEPAAPYGSGQFTAVGAPPAPSPSQQYPVPQGPYDDPYDASGEFSELGSNGRLPRAPTAADVAREAAWKQAHPSARKWAKKREAASSGRRTPHPLRIAAGVLMMGIGVYLLAVFIPAHEPGNPSGAWLFSEGQHSAAAGFAFGFLALGLYAAFRGATYRQSVSTVCGHCNMEVIASREGFALKCQNGGHRAGLQFSSIGLLAGAVVLGIGTIALIFMAG